MHEKSEGARRGHPKGGPQVYGDLPDTLPGAMRLSQRSLTTGRSRASGGCPGGGGRPSLRSPLRCRPRARRRPPRAPRGGCPGKGWPALWGMRGSEVALPQCRGPAPVRTLPNRKQASWFWFTAGTICWCCASCRKPGRGPVRPPNAPLPQWQSPLPGHLRLQGEGDVDQQEAPDEPQVVCHREPHVRHVTQPPRHGLYQCVGGPGGRRSRRAGAPHQPHLRRWAAAPRQHLRRCHPPP